MTSSSERKQVHMPVDVPRTVVIRSSPNIMRTIFYEEDHEGKWLRIRQWQESNGETKTKTISLSEEEVKQLIRFVAEENNSK